MSADWSPTPIPVPYADFNNPQSLNLYGFVGGNPASKVDADGHCPWCIGALVGAVVGAGANIVAQKIAHPGEPIKWGHVGAAAVGGAVAGATLGLAGPATLTSVTAGEAITVSTAGAGEVIATGAAGGTLGGIAERTADTGSVQKALEDPGQIALDAAGGALGEGTGHALGAVVQASNQGLKQAEAKAARLTSKSAASRVKKVTGALKKAEGKAEAQAKAAEAGGSAAVEAGKNVANDKKKEERR